MPKFTGANRDLLKQIRPYGLHLMQTKKHTWVVDKEGNRIVSCSTTPSDRNAHKNTIRWLVKMGKMPDEKQFRR